MSLNDVDAPRATYRVQLHKGFGFADAAALVDYLAELGISHLYCSPYLLARRGSLHGYDVVDHTRLNDELGGQAGHARMVETLDAHGMGHVLDLVPNHMTISERENTWWWDVLKKGPDSRYATYFDIDWDPPESRLRRMLLVPILGDHYGRVLSAGELQLQRIDDEIVVGYHDHVLPIAEGTVAADDDASLSAINSDPNRLHDVLEVQHYRLAHWRAAGHELNYRRFFSINDLAALRVEDPEVFEATHSLVLELVERGDIQGLRIDHVDGLRRPFDYLTRLRSRAPRAYVVVEKILEPEERLPSWPVEGTTGYDFLNRVQGLFVDPDGEQPLSDLYARFTGAFTDLDELAREKKLLLMDTELAADLERLADVFLAVCEHDRDYRDFTRHDLRDALRETIGQFAVYRTYVDARSGEVSPQDVRYVTDAVSAASKVRSDIDPGLFGLLEDILLLRRTGALERELVMRFQQTTGPVMAKGVEDTLFYGYNRLTSLNEVGGDPGLFGVGLGAFHMLNREAHENWPHSMLTTSTHDTKRSEDVRARINLMSEIPDRWAQEVVHWRDMNEHHRTQGMPDRNDEYLLYQTLVGAWPISVDRIVAYMDKAAKEAKTNTSWINPNPAYDEALETFVRGVCADETFSNALASFARGLVEPGRINSLAQLVLKLTSPGVPDIYQGTELWDLSLVDPDNRRPVDYPLRRRLLAEVRDAGAEQAWAEADSGAPKLLVTHRALALRAQRPGPFMPEAPYTPLSADGDKTGHLVAFARGDEVIAAVPRLVMGLGGDWGTTTLELPPGDWRDVFSRRQWSGTVAVSDLLSGFPVSLLAKD